MSKQSDGSHFDVVLYPDIARAGDLGLALQAEFDARNVPWQARHSAAPGWRYVGADVRHGELDADTLMALYERLFIVQLWTHGVRMAWGGTDDLSTLAGAIDTWLSGTPVRALACAWPFLKFGGLAEAFERGEAVEYTWHRCLHNPGRHMTRLLPFLAVASDEPRLRALVPFTSHWILGFRSTVGFPSEIRAWVVPMDSGLYQVKTVHNREIGIADAAGSVALVLQALDADRGLATIHPLIGHEAEADPRTR